VYGEKILLTYKADNAFKTTHGAIATLIILVVMIVFAGIRFNVFVTKQEPQGASKPT